MPTAMKNGTEDNEADLGSTCIRAMERTIFDRSSVLSLLVIFFQLYTGAVADEVTHTIAVNRKLN